MSDGLDPGLLDALGDSQSYLGDVGEPINTLTKLKAASAEMLSLARTGRCESDQLRAFSQLAAIQIRVLESLDQERRLKRLEKAIDGRS